MDPRVPAHHVAPDPVATEQRGVTGALTDGTGISALTTSKFVKDLVADFLLTAAATLATASVLDFGDALAAPDVAGIAIAGAAIRAVYRAALRWSTS